MTDMSQNVVELGCPSHAEKREKGLKELSEKQLLAQRMDEIRYKILVLSGKGGVGKSTVSANLAIALALVGKRVGLLDADIHGPSIPKLLNIEGAIVRGSGDAILPIQVGPNLKVMSIGLLLEERDDAVIWRGPMKHSIIKQFLKDVEWGELDYLVVDSPPGTGDEPLTVAQLIEGKRGAVVVTTPQNLALADVRKSINFCRHLCLPVIGVVENMSGFVCPKCGEVSSIFKTGGGEAMAEEMGVPFLGRIPIDPDIVEACDLGRPYVCNCADSEAAKAFGRIILPILGLDGAEDFASLPTSEAPGQREESGGACTVQNNERMEEHMRIAIPVDRGHLSPHFGHCEGFALIDVDLEKKEITQKQMVNSPPHQPGLLPRWLHDQGAELIIAGGMGARAQGLFAEQGIQVIVGASPETPHDLVISFLQGTLKTGENICDH